MPTKRDIRRCALQALYQFDAGRADAPDAVRLSLEDSAGDEEARREGFDLATRAWESRAEADRAVATLAPEWPTYRQPAIDRSILRLAWHEIMHAGTPPKVAINEAVELAREFSTEKSHLFVNGVLDAVYRNLKEQPEQSPTATLSNDVDAASTESS